MYRDVYLSLSDLASFEEYIEPLTTWCDNIDIIFVLL